MTNTRSLSRRPLIRLAARKQKILPGVCLDFELPTEHKRDEKCLLHKHEIDKKSKIQKVMNEFFIYWIFDSVRKLGNVAKYSLFSLIKIKVVFKIYPKPAS